MSRYLDAFCNALVFDRTHFLISAESFFTAFSIAFICLTIRDESRLPPQYRRLARIGLVSLCVIYVGFYLVRIEQYSRTICLIDAVEPSIISISWIWGRGGLAMYPSPLAAAQYGFPYGPTMYMSDYLFLDALGPSIRTAKLSGVSLSLASVVLIFWTLRRITSPFLAIVGTTYCLLVFLLRGISNTSFGLRAEPHLVFWVSLGLFSGSIGFSPVLAALGCGLATGMLVNVKMSAGLFALPILALLYQRHGVRPLLVAVSLAVLVAACPFLVVKGISLNNYLVWLKLVTRQGMSRSVFKRTVMEGLFVILPVVASLGCLILVDRRRSTTFLKTNRAFFLALSLGLFLLIVPASKAGGGPHHFMPFIPILALVMGMALDQPVAYGELIGYRSRCVRSAGIAFPLMAIATTLPDQLGVMRYERAHDTRAKTILSEIRAIEKQVTGKRLAMGYGGDGSFADTHVRATLVLEGNPYLIDSFAFMDRNASGLEIPAATYDAIRNGMIDVWLIPTGDEPFSFHNFYPSKATVFEPSFRKVFLDHYVIRDKTEHLDVWYYSGFRNSR